MPERKRLRCEVHEQPDGALVELHGELDLDTVAEAQAVVAAAAGARSVTLDLRGVNFIDSSGLSLIIQMAALARADGFEFSVIPSTAQNVQRLLETTAAERYIPFVDADDDP